MSTFDNESNPLVAGIGTSLVRTVVPVVVGLILTGLAKVGFDLPDGLVTEVVATVVITLYYFVVRVLETNVAPAWGWLLGKANAPKYDPLGPSSVYEPGPYDAQG